MFLNFCQILENNSLAATFKTDGSKKIVIFRKTHFRDELDVVKVYFHDFVDLENRKLFRL